MRIKKENNNNISMRNWEQIIEFSFIENEKDMKWQEKFFITAEDEKKAYEMSTKFITRKQIENKKNKNFTFSIIKDLYIANNNTVSLNSSIHSQILDINVI